MSIVLSPTAPVPFPRKRKDTDPCRSQFDDTCRSLLFSATEEKEEEKEKEEVEEEEEKEEVEEDEDEDPCEICGVVGHWPVHCPWTKDLPFGPVPKIHDAFWVTCRLCPNDEFNERHLCTKCGCDRKYVLLKRCWMCNQTGHRDNSHPRCLIYGREYNFETNPTPFFVKRES